MFEKKNVKVNNLLHKHLATSVLNSIPSTISTHIKTILFHFYEKKNQYE